jgi:small subunit ribosomal protein S6
LREYEFTFVIQPEISDEGVHAISQRFEGILANHHSEKIFYEDWGRRRLAYEIGNFQKGHYQVLHFLSDGKVVPELERSARLDDSILRFLTVLANKDVTDAPPRKRCATPRRPRARPRRPRRATTCAATTTTRRTTSSMSTAIATRTKIGTGSSERWET